MYFFTPTFDTYIIKYRVGRCDSKQARRNIAQHAEGSRAVGNVCVCVSSERVVEWVGASRRQRVKVNESGAAEKVSGDVVNLATYGGYQ